MKVFILLYVIAGCAIYGCMNSQKSNEYIVSEKKIIGDKCYHDSDCVDKMVCRKEWDSRSGTCVMYQSCFDHGQCTSAFGIDACCLIDYYGNYCATKGPEGCPVGAGNLGDSCSVLSGMGCKDGLICYGMGTCLSQAFCTHSCTTDMECHEGNTVMLCLGGTHCEEVN